MPMFLSLVRSPIMIFLPVSSINFPLPFQEKETGTLSVPVANVGY
jgi:hypothetical protein